MKKIITKRIDLKPCPWCGNIPILVQILNSSSNIILNSEVHCISKCRANPIIGFNKKYDEMQISVIWNSLDFNKISEKKSIKNLSEYNNYINKEELKNILKDLNCNEEIWFKYLPEIPYFK